MTEAPHHPATFPRSTVIAVLVATTAAQVACVMGIAVFPSIAPKLAAEMNVAPATIGYQMSLIYGAAALTSPLMSFAVPRWGASRTSQSGLALCVLAMLLALTASLPALAITSILLGVEEADYSLVAAGVMLSLVNAAGVGGRVLWGWLADRTGDSLGLLRKISMGTAVGCFLAAFLGPSWPATLVALFFIVLGTAAVGWNGLFLAEVARGSPRGKVSIATSAAMTWNYAGILIGPALFATVFKAVGSYTVTYGALALVALIAVAAFGRCTAAAKRGAAFS